MKKVLTIISIIIIISGFIIWSEFIKDRKTINERQEIMIVAENRMIPWSIDFLNDNKYIFTERPGRVIYMNKTILNINEVAHKGEGGLLGIVLHPSFEENNYVYIYYTYEERGNLFNKIVRYEMIGEELINEENIIDSIPGNSYHNGGRMKFGPDNKLYVTTGDAGHSDLAQNISSLAGKILRINSDGSIPEDNPFNNSFVYSYGHRNPQGIAWDEQGRLWSTEHGSTATDELNIIRPGNNYGWPIIRGDEEKEGMTNPVIQSSYNTWAPSGLTYYNNSLFFTGLRGQTLYKAEIISSEEVILTKHLEKEYGRLRTIVLGPDDYFYILTSNKDGRNPNPAENDDLIIRISPDFLKE